MILVGHENDGVSSLHRMAEVAAILLERAEDASLKAVIEETNDGHHTSGIVVPWVVQLTPYAVLPALYHADRALLDSDPREHSSRSVGLLRPAAAVSSPHRGAEQLSQHARGTLPHHIAPSACSIQEEAALVSVVAILRVVLHFAARARHLLNHLCDKLQVRGLQQLREWDYVGPARRNKPHVVRDDCLPTDGPLRACFRRARSATARKSLTMGLAVLDLRNARGTASSHVTPREAERP
mmetsp:Transcript_101470/g.295686  ORF Transcript_101470/g.295686 Transcript_101470/m.295686 type:complete len:239 (-) Transcript_101470:14-730(-)